MLKRCSFLKFNLIADKWANYWLLSVYSPSQIFRSWGTVGDVRAAYKCKVE